MHRFSTRSPVACLLVGMLVFLSLLLFPWSVENVDGADVSLAWDPNPEANLKGYKVYYGSASGSYSFMVDAGNRTSLTISGLAAGKTYYFAATAYGYAGEESEMSHELRYDTPIADSPFLSPAHASNGISAGYTIHASAGPNGSISPSGNIAVRRGSRQTFIIRPDRGYRIGRVNIDGATIHYVTSHSFTQINANHTIRAEFELIRSRKNTAPAVPLTRDSRHHPGSPPYFDARLSSTSQRP